MTKQMTNRLKFDMIKVLQNGRHGALLLLPTQEVIYMANAGMKPAAPADYTSALSELLPQLIEKYSREAVGMNVAPSLRAFRKATQACLTLVQMKPRSQTRLNASLKRRAIIMRFWQSSPRICAAF